MVTSWRNSSSCCCVIYSICTCMVLLLSFFDAWSLSQLIYCNCIKKSDRYSS